MTTPSTSTTRDSRVSNAVQQLLERLVPARRPGESENAAERRWEEANHTARRLLDPEDGFEEQKRPAEDVGFAADLIKKRLLDGVAQEGRGGRGGRGGGLEKVTGFGNLYSRLLAQPVLGQKWGILYFLYRLGDQEEEEDGRESEDDGVKSSFDRDAFSRNGLHRMPGGIESPRPQLGDRDRGVPARTKAQEVQKEEDEEDEVFKEKSGPSETALLRDLPFTLQGLSSTNLTFADEKSLRLPSTLPVPLVSLLHTLAEPALLYRSLSAYTESTDRDGLISQSLRSAISTELRSYLALVAQLEGQVRRALQQVDVNLPHGGLGKAGVTLKRMVVWTRDATFGLRLMSLIVDSARGKKGGELITLIHSYATSHGDPFVHAFAERLLTSITRPFYSMLRAWIFNGELEDPYQEFFVYESKRDHEDVGGGATSVWEHKYAFQSAMVPSIMSPDFANRVFLIGKSLNFIRYSCADSAWVESYSQSASRELSYGDTATLSSSIDTAYSTVMARLLHLMESKFALFTHLAALKKYLLLGQGDFVALLMESLASNLDRPANSQYRHTLTAQLEHAIRNSNAQHDDPDVLRRLDARMLELSHGEIGWDVFTLEYRIDSPLDVIVTPWASKQYLKVFNFLWRVKRVEFALGTTWRRCMTGARGVLSSVGVGGNKLGDDWKAARGAMAEMVHFINQLQWYILFEVVEAGWEGLQKAIRREDATLDTLITAHTNYLRGITRKGLLGGGHVDFTAQLHELLKLMLAYRDAVDGLYSLSVAEFTRRQERAAKIETRTKAGKWGVSEADEEDPLNMKTRDGDFAPLLSLPSMNASSGLSGEQAILEQLRQRLATLGAEFKQRINVLLGDLREQPDPDMRFLGVVMNFNDVYQPVRRRRHRGEKERGAR